MSRCGLHYPGKADQISEFVANGDAKLRTRDPDSVITLPETQPFRHFPMEKFPCGDMLRTGIPIHLRGKSAKNRQWRGNGAFGTGMPEHGS